MEWLMMNPQVQGSFSSLGSLIRETYVASPNCLEILNEMVQRLSMEDRTLRTLRRAIGFSQVVKKDLLPLLMNMKENRKITDTTIKVLADLTTPIECLLPIDVMSKCEAGRNTIIELNWLLISCKETFLDPRGTRRIVDHIRDILYKGDKLDDSDCETLNNCVILLRNILHIPDSMLNVAEGFSDQSQILWNLFAHNFDKVLIDLMTGSDMRKGWRIAAAQLVVLLYRDQRVATLQKLLNLWMESCELSESSEDNESNTSPPEEESFSSLATSDPMSDSSDNSGSSSDRQPEIKLYGKRKFIMKQSYSKKHEDKQQRRISHNAQMNLSKLIKKPDLQHYKLKQRYRTRKRSAFTIRRISECLSPQPSPCNTDHLTTGSSSSDRDQKMNSDSSKTSDRGYNTQAENQESVSTSSYDDDPPNRSIKPIHHKPANLIQKRKYPTGKTLLPHEKEELRRKKLLRRSQSNFVPMKAFLHHTPTEEDVAHLLKEFTVDFLLKAYGTLMSELRSQLLLDSNLDRTHFSWLVAYFLKFVVQLELDLHHVRGVLSYEVITFMVYEGANLCEQYEILSTQLKCDMSASLRKVHLVIAAIKELLQSINTYKSMKHLSDSDRMYLTNLQKEVSETEDIRCLFVALIRQYNPQVHSKQYLRDLVVTNHILLSFIENSVLPDRKSILQAHLKHFVPVEMMRQYGYLLESYRENTNYVNDCVFSMMHHVAGDMEHVSSLFQPSILKTFSFISENRYEVSQEWSDLIEYVIRKFVASSQPIPNGLKMKKKDMVASCSSRHEDGWKQEESNCLYWYYVQSANLQDPIGNIRDLYTQNGAPNISRNWIIEQLLKQDVVNTRCYNELLKNEQISAEKRVEEFAVLQRPPDEIDILKEHLLRDEKEGGQVIIWLQKALLETCYAKIFLDKQREYIIEPIIHFSVVLKIAVPLMPWSLEHQRIMHSEVFLLLIRKLGLLLPIDIGKVFARIPASWTPEVLFFKATCLGPLRKEWTKYRMLTFEYFKGNPVEEA